MNREDKPVYMEDGKVVSLYVVEFEREGGKMATVPKKADEDLWYLQIVKNFVLPRDEDFAVQPPTVATSPVHALQSSAVNEELPPSPPRAPINEQLDSSKAAEDEVGKITKAKNPEVEKPVEVESEETVDPRIMVSAHLVGHDAEKGKFIPEDPVITIPVSPPTSAPVNVEKNPAEDHGASVYDEENDPLCPDETLGDHYYRTYTEKKASEVHTQVWNLKKGDTFSNWRVCRDWLKGTFPPAEIKFKEDRDEEQAYHAYLEEAVRYTSTTHHIVREWCSMCKEWVAYEASKKKPAEN
ncbi:hypothetical protein Hdeb2414_s0003g00089331 [Helianthus debilis subsp. tardiflorus]